MSMSEQEETIPDAMARAVETLREVWGYPDFRTGQRDVVEAAVAGRDVLGVLPTGGGKSICFQVPALIDDGLTLVVSPLIALMEDQVAALRARGVEAAFINSGMSYRQIDQAWTDAEFGRYRLLYVSPERLATEQFQVRAPRLNIKRIAVDEAHCISEWGHHFRPEYRRIADALEMLDHPHVIAVTATATPEVRRDIVKQLGLRDPAVIVRGFDRPNIVWSVFQPDDRQQQVRRVLDGVHGSGIIYGPTRRSVEQWAEWLERHGYGGACYHAGMPLERRQQVQEAWLNGSVRVIAATNAFGMGIDKPDVRFVIHDGISSSLESYYQEAGRAGRDGKKSYAVLLDVVTDRSIQQSLIDSAHPDRKVIQEVYDTVCSLAQIAHGSESVDPVIVDLNAVARITGARISVIKSAVEVIERQDVWRLISTDASVAFIHMSAQPDVIRKFARGQSRGLKKFIDSLLRAIDGAAYRAWTSVDIRGLARATGLAEDRLKRGLDFLQQRELLKWMAPGDGLALELTTSRYVKLPVEMGAIDQSRSRANQKLADMIRYATHTGCRRRFLLDYFGEWMEGSCTGCDHCLGRHSRPAVTKTDEGRIRDLLLAIRDGTAADVGRLEDEWGGEEVERLLDWLEVKALLDEPDGASPLPVLTERAHQLLGRIERTRESASVSRSRA